MPKYDLREPLEGLGLGNQPFTDFRSIHTHHPGTNQSAVRAGNPNGLDDKGAVVDGEVEVVRTENGRTLIKKDIIFLDDKGGANVQVPAPIAGYAHYLSPNDYGSVRMYTKPFGTPGAELVGQVLHMDPSTFKFKEGERIEYGQPLGQQSGKGPNGLHQFGTHAHVELELEQFKKYITDLKSGAITQEAYPAKGSPNANPAQPANAMSDGVLQQGEKGAEVRAMQEQLIKSGITTINGKPFIADSDYGPATKAAVTQYQQTHNLHVDGVAGKDTLAALKIGAPAQTTPTTPSPAPGPAQTHGGTTALSNLIGRGEGDYNSYNRGNAGDAGKPLNLTDMTVGEIMRRQHLSHNDPNYLFAVGKFQMVGPPANTMGETVKALGIDPNAKFTADLQEKMFANYLIDGKRPAVNDYITGKSSGAAGLEKAQHALALEFASVGDPRKGGRGAYDGDSAGNSASIKVAETATALNQMRTQYQANIGKGLSPDAAYDALRGQAPNQGTTPSAPGTSNNQTGALSDGMLKQGEKGAEVKALQEQLIKSGITTINGKPFIADSDYGPATKAAVTQYQQTHHLHVDGVAGKDTLAALKAGTPAPTTATPTAPAPTGTTASTPTKPDATAPTSTTPTPTSTTTPAPAKAEPAGISASLAASEGILMQGSKGADVVKLQEQLSKLGYTDAKGQPIKADGDFGQGTKEALMAFEKSRGMEQNGIVGPKTFEALNKAEQAPKLSDASHPDNAMYKQADALLAKLPNGTFKSEQERNNAAGAVTYEARVSGMTQIDAIIPNKSGNGLIATQGNSQTTGERIVVQKDAAVTQPVDKSTQMIAQDAPTQAAKVVEAPVKTTEQPEQPKKPSILMA